VATPDALLGPANLVEVAAGRHARVRVDDAGVAHAEVLDTSSPAQPAILADLPLDVVVDPPDVFSATERHLFFCARPAAGAGRQLTSVDLRSPAGPTPPEVVDDFACYLEPEGRFAAHGSTWISWNLPTGFWAQSTYAYAVAPDGAESVVDYAYNQTGVHQYGNVRRAATDGTRAVFDPENASLFLVADTVDGPNGAFAWVTFAGEGPQRLLGVVEAVAYLTTPSGVSAYDVADVASPVASPFHAAIAFEGEPRLIAASRDYLVVADGDGPIHLVPRDAAGVVPPLVVAEGPPPAPPPGCE
jgi:hypothetical protein